MFTVVFKKRRLARFDRVFKPVCPVTGCEDEADHEVKNGPKWVWRGCGEHAYEEATRLNEEATA